MNNEEVIVNDILNRHKQISLLSAKPQHAKIIKKIAPSNHYNHSNKKKELNYASYLNYQNNSELLSNNHASSTIQKDIKKSIEGHKNEKNGLKASNINLAKRGSSPLPLNHDKSKKTISERHNDFLKEKYQKYDTQDLIYQLDKQFSKVNINNSQGKFIERMDFSVSKQQIREYKINELVEQSKPHLHERDKIATFNRLIEDANRRAEARKRNKDVNSDTILMEVIHNNISHRRNSSVPITHKQWEKIYNDRFLTKLTNANEKIKEKRQKQIMAQEEESKKIEEERKMKNRVVSKKEIVEIGTRLYNNRHKSKKDMTSFHTIETAKNLQQQREKQKQQRSNSQKRSRKSYNGYHNNQLNNMWDFEKDSREISKNDLHINNNNNNNNNTNSKHNTLNDNSNIINGKCDYDISTRTEKIIDGFFSKI